MNSHEHGRPALDVALQHLDGHAELLLIGELDVGTAPVLRDALDQLVLEGNVDVWLNMSGLRFLDAAAVGALNAAHQQLAGLGGRLRVGAAHGIPLRVLSICGMLERFTADAGDDMATLQRTDEQAGTEQ